MGCLQAQAKAVVKTQVQLAAVSMDKMARTSCGHATRPMPANQARTAEVKAVHTKRVTFAATSPNKAATSHVATAVTGAKQGVLCSCNAIYSVAMVSLIIRSSHTKSACKGCLCNSVYILHALPRTSCVR